MSADRIRCFNVGIMLWAELGRRTLGREGLLPAHPCRTAGPYRMADSGAQRKHVTLSIDFRSLSENGRSRSGHRMARNAPVPAIQHGAAHRFERSRNAATTPWAEVAIAG